MVSPEGGWLRAACGAGCGAGLRRALQKLWRCSMASGIGVCAGKHAYQRRMGVPQVPQLPDSLNLQAKIAAGAYPVSASSY
jgi:hypothetical protein